MFPSNRNIQTHWDTNDDPNQQSLPFQQVRHEIATFDAQPSSEGGIIVLVTGALLVRPPMHYHKKHASLTLHSQ